MRIKTLDAEMVSKAREVAVVGMAEEAAVAEKVAMLEEINSGRRGVATVATTWLCLSSASKFRFICLV